MPRSARRPEPETSVWAHPLQAGAAGVLGMVSRNPVMVGGFTAFMVALGFVSANALWYQPHVHKGAFFATRDFAGPVGTEPEEPETTFRIERPPETKPVAVADPRIREVQKTLKDLNFYAGEVDGIAGPATRRAIETYQAKIGMAVTGMADDHLLDQLGATPTTAGITPSPAPRGTAPAADAGNSAMSGSDRIKRVQAGLKAFGNEAIDIDGVMGSRTRAALREFQSLFGLPETGEADQVVEVKMKEIGLIN